MRGTETPHSIINQQSIDRIKAITWDSHPLTQSRKESFLRKYACNEAFEAKSWEANIWDEYAFSYKTAANILIEDIRNGDGRWDNTVIPLIFLYRHHVEMMLKSGVALMQLSRNEFKELPIHHHLLDLWKSYKVELEAMNVENSILTWMEKDLKDFLDLENNAVAFRYPVTKDGLTSTLRFGHIPPPDNVCNETQKMFSYLEIADVMLKSAVYKGWDDIHRNMKHMFAIVNAETDRLYAEVYGAFAAQRRKERTDSIEQMTKENVESEPGFPLSRE
jgi:hypothetical protein